MAADDDFGKLRFRGWASAGPAATTSLRRTPVPVSDLRVDSPVTPGVGGFALAKLDDCMEILCLAQLGPRQAAGQTPMMDN